MKNARTAALSALLHVDVNEGYSNIVIDKTLKEFQLDSRDSALATAIFYGVLERRITLDHYISLFCKKPEQKIAPEVLEILRIAVYQIVYMEKIPGSAAVNEAVNCARAIGDVKACGFINGILRAMLRSPERLMLPDEKEAPPRHLSVKYSCPEWIIRLWRRAYGEKHTLGLLNSLLTKSPVYARVNTTKISEQGLLVQLAESSVKANAVTQVPGALELHATGPVALLDSFQKGLFHIQDLSSQLCCRLVAPVPGGRVTDVCSAPGGKAFTLAELMENRGELFAFDKYKGKVGLIRQGAQRLGLSIISAGVRDAADPGAPDPPAAQRVLCDAPCSGLGIIRRKPEIRYKQEAALDSLTDLQYLILCRSARLAAADGLLFYSTCTLNPAENGAVADRFLREHPDFEAFPLTLPDSFGRAVAEPENQMTLLPHIHGTDGFFISAFRRRS